MKWLLIGSMLVTPTCLMESTASRSKSLSPSDFTEQQQAWIIHCVEETQQGPDGVTYHRLVTQCRIEAIDLFESKPHVTKLFFSE